VLEKKGPIRSGLDRGYKEERVLYDKVTGMDIALLLACLAGLADLFGGWLTVIKREMSRRTILHLTALGAGFILSAGILDRLPEAMEDNPHGALYILIGFTLIYLLENFFSTHAHPLEGECALPEESHGHALVSNYQDGKCIISKAASYTALAGLLLHTFFDGAAIAAGFATSVHTGILMFLAVILHKIPEGFSISSLMLAANQGRRRALVASLSLGISTVIGAILTGYLSHDNLGIARVILTLATGTFLYIGASDLIPATNRAHDRWCIAFVLLGILLFYLSLKLIDMAGIHP
jgi:zinc transporter ZupT